MKKLLLSIPLILISFLIWKPVFLYKDIDRKKGVVHIKTYTKGRWYSPLWMIVTFISFVNDVLFNYSVKEALRYIKEDIKGNPDLFYKRGVDLVNPVSRFTFALVKWNAIYL